MRPTTPTPAMQAVLLLLALLPATQAFFIFGHKTLLRSRMDPIVNPGGVSSHVHNIVGASSFAKTYDYDAQRKGKCTTAIVQEDKSSYWTPQLYWRNTTDDTYQAIESETKTYYIPRNSTNHPLTAFPPGFQMLAGDMNRRTNNASNKADNAVSYVCQDFTTSHQGDPEWFERPDFFKHNCPNGMRVQIFFPQCWDGVNVDSPNHKDHVAYPIEQYNGGTCPKTHPVQLIGLFYEFIYHVQDFPFDTTPGAINWVLSTGDTTGLGHHGDFINGWPAGPDGALQRTLDNAECYASGGSVEACPVLLPLEDADSASACQPEMPIVDEDIGFGHPIKRLPGDNPLWIGTGPKPSWGEPKVTPQYINVTTTPASGYAPLGCISEAPSGRALLSLNTVLSNNSAAACTTFCSAQGYAYAGVEYGNQCYCDNALRNGATTQNIPDNQCSVPCSGNQGSGTTNIFENCGGPGTLNLFFNSALQTALQTKLAGPLSNGWLPYNCVNEAASGRTLTGANFQSSSMTNELCATTCAQKGFTISGTQYSTQCYCGNSFINGGGANATDPSSCSMACSGGSGYCGGANRLTVYTGASQLPQASLPNGWSPYGCVAEPSNGRALIGFSLSASNMTSTYCVSQCASRGFSIAGTEYGRECYCSNAFTAGTGALVADSDCSMTCAGNSEICGAGGRLSVFKATAPSASSSPLFSSTAASASKSSLSSASSATPVSSSIPASSSSLQASSSSIASSVLPSASSSIASSAAPSSASPLSSSSASASRSSIASFAASSSASLAPSSSASLTPSSSASVSKPSSSSISSISSSQASTSTSTLSSSSTAPAPSVSPLSNGWTSYNCVVDSTGSRSLTGYSFTSDSMTNELCASTCAKKGFTFAGTEYSRECYCGNAISNNAANATASSCSMKCSGGADTCGGSARLTVFTGASQLPQPVLPNRWASIGCIVEAKNGRALTGYSFSASNMTSTLCAQTCSNRGFTIAGTEYSSECYCGNALSNGGGAGAPATDCNMFCSGNGELCGGPSRLSAFRLTQ